MPFKKVPMYFVLCKFGVDERTNYYVVLIKKKINTTLQSCNKFGSVEMCMVKT